MSNQLRKKKLPFFGLMKKKLQTEIVQNVFNVFGPSKGLSNKKKILIDYAL